MRPLLLGIIALALMASQAASAAPTPAAAAGRVEGHGSHYLAWVQPEDRYVFRWSAKGVEPTGEAEGCDLLVRVQPRPAPGLEYGDPSKWPAEVTVLRERIGAGGERSGSATVALARTWALRVDGTGCTWSVAIDAGG